MSKTAIYALPKSNRKIITSIIAGNHISPHIMRDTGLDRQFVHKVCDNLIKYGVIAVNKIDFHNYYRLRYPASFFLKLYEIADELDKLKPIEGTSA